MDKSQLINRIKKLTKEVYSNVSKAEIVSSQYDELVKFPELKRVITDLLTTDFDSFVSSIDWVAPRPTTFRINLKNDQYFYLIYGNISWIAQVEGKKYFILNLPEEEAAAKAISRLLRYGIPSSPEGESEEGNNMEGGVSLKGRGGGDNFSMPSPPKENFMGEPESEEEPEEQTSEIEPGEEA